MAVLTACWVIIETVIIPNGLRKWFCLSFFINPLILFFCQIFLWLKLLIKCLIFLLVLRIKVIYFVCVFIFRALRVCVIFFWSFIKSKKSPQVQEEVEQYFEAQASFEFDRISHSNVLYIAESIRSEIKLLEFEDDVSEEVVDHGQEDVSPLVGDENVDKAESYLRDAMSKSDDFFRCIYSFTTDDDDQSSSDSVEDSIPCENMEEPTFYGQEDTIPKEYFLCASESPNREDQHMNGYPPTAYPPEFQLVERESFGGEAEVESDGLYKVYTERMRWFDVLNYDRTCGISAIESKQIGTPSPFKSIKYPDSDYDVSRISWSKMASRRLLRSFENEFEMVYVAQSCLTWKALYHQYSKVKALQISSFYNKIYCIYVVGEFQKFQILMERFMENEQSEGKRVWNYVRERFSLKGLLQVPEVSVKGLMEKDKENMKSEGTNIKGLLRVIEECIQIFWLFVKTDNSKKSWWKVRTSSWTYPHVEDPRDLEQLAYLTKRLQKNKLRLKDLEGKKRCLLKRIVNPLEESQRQEMLFTMIDMKLVSRVLQMSMISSAQLKWCQEKLDNVEFKDGRVFRASTDPLFPH